MKRNLPHCWVCKCEGDCSNGTMHNIMFRKQPIDGAMGVGFYLCNLHYEELKASFSQEPLLCDKSREPPCHLEPSKELCQKCELNKTSVANGLTSEEKQNER